MHPYFHPPLCPSICLTIYFSILFRLIHLTMQLKVASQLQNPPSCLMHSLPPLSSKQLSLNTFLCTHHKFFYSSTHSIIHPSIHASIYRLHLLAPLLISTSKPLISTLSCHPMLQFIFISSFEASHMFATDS